MMDLTKIEIFHRVTERNIEYFNDRVNELLNKGYVIISVPFVTDESSGTHRMNICDMGLLKKEPSAKTKIKD